MSLFHLFERKAADANKVSDDPLTGTETGGNTPPPVSVTTMYGDTDPISTSAIRHEDARFPSRSEIRTHDETEYTV